MAFEALFVLPGHSPSSSFVLEASQQDFTPTTQLMGLFSRSPVTLTSKDSVFILLILSAIVNRCWPSSQRMFFTCFPAQTTHFHSPPSSPLSFSLFFFFPGVSAIPFQDPHLGLLFSIYSRTSSSFGFKYHLFIEDQLPPKLISSPNPVAEFQTHISAFFGPSLVLTGI